MNSALFVGLVAGIQQGTPAPRAQSVPVAAASTANSTASTVKRIVALDPAQVSQPWSQQDPAHPVGVNSTTASSVAVYVPELAKRIATPMVFVNCSDLKKLDASFAGLGISKLFNDPEVWEFLKTNPEIAKYEGIDPNKINAPLLAWYDGVRKEARIPEHIWKQFIEACQGGFLSGEVSCAIDGADENLRGRDMPKVFVMGDIGSEPAKVDQLMADLAAHVRDVTKGDFARRTALDNVSFYELGAPANAADFSDDPVFCLSRKGSHVFMTAPEPDVMVQLLTSRPPALLADDPNFQDAQKFFGPDKGNFYVYVDGASLTRQARQGPKNELGMFGLSRLRWIGMTMEGAGEFMRHRVEVRANVKRGIPTLFSTKPEFQLAAYLPERTLASAQMVVDGTRNFAAFRKMFDDFSENPEDDLIVSHGQRFKSQFDLKMFEMRREIGTDIREVLTLLGDEVAIAIVPPESGFIPDVYFIAKTKDVASAERCKQIVEEGLRRTQRKAVVRESKFQEYRISYAQLEESPLFPSMFVDEDRFVLGSNLSAVKRYIQFRKSGAPSLAVKPSFLESVRAVNDGPATGYLWIDWPSVTNFVYGNFSGLAPLFMGVSAYESLEANHPPTPEEMSQRSYQHDFKFDWAKLPSAETISRYVPPQILRVRIDKQGYSLDSRAFF